MAKRVGRVEKFMRKTGYLDGKPENEKPSVVSANKFTNDGSFMEMFKRKMAEGNSANTNKSDQNKSHSAEPENTGAGNDELNKGIKRTADDSSSAPGSSTVASENTSYFPIVGKRRGPKILKTGMVAKKKEEEQEDDGKESWSRYLDEVRKYKSQKCIEDDVAGTPLVK